jgi:DUF971 family protein
MPNLTRIAPTQAGKQPALANSIRFEFDTGEAFELESRQLRFECPCANCVDEMSGKRTLKLESVAVDVKPVKIEPVGRYGIHIEWSDGHRTGMYHFDNLYRMLKRS